MITGIAIRYRELYVEASTGLDGTERRTLYIKVRPRLELLMRQEKYQLTSRHNISDAILRGISDFCHSLQLRNFAK